MRVVTPIILAATCLVGACGGALTDAPAPSEAVDGAPAGSLAPPTDNAATDASPPLAVASGPTGSAPTDAEASRLRELLATSQLSPAAQVEVIPTTQVAADVQGFLSPADPPNARWLRVTVGRTSASATPDASRAKVLAYSYSMHADDDTAPLVGLTIVGLSPAGQAIVVEQGRLPAIEMAVARAALPHPDAAAASVRAPLSPCGVAVTGGQALGDQVVIEARVVDPAAFAAHMAECLRGVSMALIGTSYELRVNTADGMQRVVTTGALAGTTMTYGSVARDWVEAYDRAQAAPPAQDDPIVTDEDGAATRTPATSVGVAPAAPTRGSEGAAQGADTAPWEDSTPASDGPIMSDEG